MDQSSVVLELTPAAGPPHVGDQRLAAAPLTRPAIGMLAAACGLAVANANYAQPLLVAMGQSVNLSGSMLGLIPALTQFGVTLGVAFLLPLGDMMSAGRLLTVTIALQAAALAGVALAPNGTCLLLLSLMVGFFGITPYVLPPYATLRTPLARRGKVTALLAQGVIVGMLLARAVSGVIGLQFGWQTVYALAAVAMLLLLWPLRRVLLAETPVARTGYLALMRSVALVFRTVPVVRWSALCQGLATGSFTTLWIGISLYMQGPAFGWRSDGVGGLALIGAAAAMAAPFVGGFADRRGPRFSLLAALTALLLSWGVLVVFGHAVIGIIIGMIILDLGATAADISNRTVIFSLRPDVRTRLATIYMIGKFGGGGIAASLTGVVWADHGWRGVCGLGGALAAMAFMTALLRVHTTVSPR
ncbi:MAG TPA: MFS transporter [Rhodopila sp.]|jgi:MFS family permease|nr:MFS transporter [Rhodopila sp.]